MALQLLGVEAVVKGFSKFQRQLGQMNKSIQKSGKGIKRMGSLVTKAGRAVAKFGVLAGAAAVAGIAAVGAISIKTAISVESAFTGVAKTTEGLVDELGQMTEAGKEVFQGFRDLAKEVPVAIEELLAIGEIGGQLGVAKEALVGFTEVVAALGVTTVLTQEEAAQGLARIAGIFEVSSEDLVENTRRAGSAIVDLGNNFKVNEQEILNFATRLAGVGKVAGLTQADIFGIATAFGQVGVSAERGGTAVQKVFIDMVEAIAEGGDELLEFSRITGIAADDFAKEFEENAALVFEKFVTGLGEAGNEATLILKDLGLADQRLVQAFLSVGGASGTLLEALDASNTAFEEGNALAKEADLRYATTESQLKIFKNTLRDVGITIGSALLPFLNKMLNIVKPFIEEFGKKFPEFINNFLLPVLKKVQVWFSDIGPSVLKKFVQFFDPIIDGINNLFGAFQESTPVAQEAIRSFLNWFSTNMAPTIQTIVDNIGGILDALAELWRQHGDTVIRFVEAFMRVVSVVFGGAFSILTGSVRALLTGLSGDWEGAWETMKQTFFTFFDSILSLLDVSRDEFLATWEGIRINVQIIVRQITSQILLAFNTMVESWRGIWENIKTIVVTIWDSIVRAIESKINRIIRFVTDKFNELKEKLKQILGIGSPSKVFRGIGEDMVDGLAKGVVDAFSVRESQAKLAATKVARPISKVAAGPVSGSSISSSTSVNMEFNNNIQDRIDVELLANRVEQRLVRALGS